MQNKTFLTIEQALKDSNSITNQHIQGELVEREVMACVSSLVEYILGKDDRDAPFNWNDVENYYSYPEYYGTYANFGGGTEEERDDEVERLENILSEAEDDLNDGEESVGSLIQDEIDDLNNLESEPQEVYEWWMVTRWLYEKLKAQGEVVIDGGWPYYYGRCCSGQAILLDHNIGVICADMGILEGQENSWADKK